MVNDRTVVIDDVTTPLDLIHRDRQSPGALGLRAVLAPVLRNGGGSPVWCRDLASATTRTWTRAEISLAEEVAERVWAAIEHVRAEGALREREAQFRSLFEAIDEGVFVLEPAPPRPDGLRDWRFVAMGKQAQTWPAGRI